MNDLIFFLPAIIALGVMTSYEDIKYGKIRNKWIIAALIYAFMAYIALIVFYYLAETLNVRYLLELLTNTVAVIAVGFGAWFFGVWTAGDGKLFIAFSLLIPLSSYKLGYHAWVPSISLLINIFVPALLIVVVSMFFRMKKNHVKNAFVALLKEIFEPKKLIVTIASLFAILWLVELALSKIGLGNSFLIRAALAMAIYALVESKMKTKAIYFMLAISSLRLILDKTVYSLEFLIQFLFVVVLWRLLSSFLRGSIPKLGEEVFTDKVKVDSLKPGMVLGDIIQKKEKATKQELDELKKKPYTEIIKYEGTYLVKKPKEPGDFKNFIGDESEGITRAQINKLKKIGVKDIRVSHTIAFAPFIFLGAILTIVSNGNVLILIINLFM
jgi:hypothetical protein